MHDNRFKASKERMMWGSRKMASHMSKLENISARSNQFPQRRNAPVGRGFVQFLSWSSSALYCKHVELECGRRVGGGEAKILAMIAIFLLHLPTSRSPMVRYPHLPLHHTDAYLDALAHFVDFILMQSHNRPDAKPFGVKTLPRCIFGCGLLFSLQLSDP